jgi:hypothetical protein
MLECQVILPFLSIKEHCHLIRINRNLRNQHLSVRQIIKQLRHTAFSGFPKSHLCSECKTYYGNFETLYFCSRCYLKTVHPAERQTIKNKRCRIRIQHRWKQALRLWLQAEKTRCAQTIIMEEKSFRRWCKTVQAHIQEAISEAPNRELDPSRLMFLSWEIGEMLKKGCIFLSFDQRLGLLENIQAIFPGHSKAVKHLSYAWWECGLHRVISVGSWYNPYENDNFFMSSIQIGRYHNFDSATGCVILRPLMSRAAFLLGLTLSEFRRLFRGKF